jgi:DNA-binding HxlR family transcriptional regulator
MDRLPFSDRKCSIARTVDIVGDRWTPLIVRDVALGISRFDAIQRNLGVSRKVLTQRLQLLLDHEVITRTEYQDNPPRFDYSLTEKGNDLAMVVLAIQQFGDKWSFSQAGPPLLWRHLGCGEISNPVVCCDKCGEVARPGEAVPLRGPSFDEDVYPEVGPAIDRIQAFLEAEQSEQA